MTCLNKDEILEARDLKTEEVEVPEWGGYVLVSMMTGRARDAYENSLFEMKDGKAVRNMENVRAKLVSACIVDEEGELIFDDEDVARLSLKSGAALDRVFSVAQRINFITDEDLDDLAKS